jgi:hypothetical protein
MVLAEISGGLGEEPLWAPVASSPSVDRLNVPSGFERREVAVPLEGEARFLRLRVSTP